MCREPTSTNVAVIGSGSWATALVKIFSENLPKVGWWVRSEKIASHIQRFGRNPSYLSSVGFHVHRLDIRAELSSLIRDYQIIVLAMPSIFLKDTFQGVAHSLFKEKKWISSIKGLLPDDTNLVSDYLKTACNINSSDIGILSGPCHAEEVAMERLSYLTVAFNDISQARFIAGTLKRPYVSVCVSDDVMGIEYAVVLKNIFALAVGMANGLGYGDNFQAVLISNAMQEMASFLEVFCPQTRDINRSSYLGDLLVTSYSSLSRNRTLGYTIGKGCAVSEALSEMPMIAEGFFATKGVINLIGNDSLSMPIARAVYKILYEKAPAGEVFKHLHKFLS
ncbi:NAD(P)H-dependent glycerol-3-phosphate dehydrogenase [Bacteroidetes bacterium endosymbiont of Geopemphigus sp.]|uniref:NAD(P)H-dependent glycerol-3-phosphate dehydrogenase n=1 Tax=Bacteroidetes bacterium endosymbiont of Geopemphigus sp. TaxID=2047937 RepID=UPI000CD2C3E8|nr:NAD(P)H-dependent glycerol-3-phosphate dehydrogenase [Bacteroidetes bacterium endosymbiont of Geopemphigus sp.]